jgi:Spy/CpxP family protein refolding chaperone
MTPDQREEARLYSKRYHSENREAALAKMRERNRAYYLKNSDRIKAQALAYQLENAEARSAYKNEWAK